MNLKRAATIVVVGAALLAWLAGAATSNRTLAPAPLPSVPAIDTRGAALEKEIARLHERLRPSATPNQSGRNLFSFRTARARTAPMVATPPVLVESPPLPRPLNTVRRLALR